MDFQLHLFQALEMNLNRLPLDLAKPLLLRLFPPLFLLVTHHGSVLGRQLLHLSLWCLFDQIRQYCYRHLHLGFRLRFIQPQGLRLPGLQRLGLQPAF